MNGEPWTDPGDDAERRAALARWRFVVIGMVRMAGALIVMIGLLVTMHRVRGVPFDYAEWIGFGVSILGLATFAVGPRLLERRWASPRDKS